MTVTIRAASDDDRDAITELHNVLLPTTTTEWRDEPHDPADRAAWMAGKTERAQSLEELLFDLIVLGDDRLVERVVIA